MATSNIQYKYALGDDGWLIDIESLGQGDRREYKCAGCGNVLLPVLGKIRQKHFRHKTQQNCSPETYLHRMGKLLFIKKYKECLSQNSPYSIEYATQVICKECSHGPCEKGKAVVSENLTERYTEIKEEEKDGQFIPDVLLESQSGETIYIEVAVTHKCTDDKIDSQKKIIEFRVKEEADLKIFSKSNLEISNMAVWVYNFNPIPIFKSYYSQCYKDGALVLPTGKSNTKIESRYENDGGTCYNSEDYVTCSICGKFERWASLNPNKCKKCVEEKWANYVKNKS